VITETGWYNCDPPRTGRYFTLWHQSAGSLKISNIQAYPFKYVTDQALEFTSSSAVVGSEASNLKKIGPQGIWYGEDQCFES